MCPTLKLVWMYGCMDVWLSGWVEVSLCVEVEEKAVNTLSDIFRCSGKISILFSHDN